MIQLAALAVAAAQGRLSANFGTNAEQFAIQEMLAAQIIFAGMLFPFLLRDVATTVVIIASAAPFLLLSSFLSATPRNTVATLYVYLALWLLALGFWRAALPTRSHFLAIAVANLLTLGIPLLKYFHLEFSNDANHQSLLELSPLTQAITLIDAPALDFHQWGPILLLLFAGGSAVAIRSLDSSKREVE